MKHYKHTLDPSSKKFFCPKCNKKTFVLYIETETGNYLKDEFGRCDRESRCSYYNNPKTKIINKFEIKNYNTIETSFHNYELVIQSGQNFVQNNFVQFLETLFTKDEVKKAIAKYFLGTSKVWSGATVYWQIDSLKKVRHGKIMLHNSETGKRTKRENGKAFISSARSVLKIKNFNLKQCLFGLHLINETKKETIAIVESEKTAIIMSIFKPNYVWLSTGSKLGFKIDMLKPIKNFRIIAFPDKSEYNDWLNKSIELNAIGYKIVINDWLEYSDYPNGTDLADVYINEVKTLETVQIDAITKDLINFRSNEIEVYIT
jgi:hypothetical protein